MNNLIKVNDYRMRLERAGLFSAFDQARKAKDKEALREVLTRARFTDLEIESLVWSTGDIPEPPTPEEKRKQLWDEVVGRIGSAVITGIVLGGIFVYASTGLDRYDTASRRSDKLMADHRSPLEAYYKPFGWGFGIGAVAGLVTAEGFLIGLMKRWKQDE